MEDIKFLREQVERERLKNYQQILDILKEEPVDNRVKFAKRFLFGIIKGVETRDIRKKQSTAMQKQHLTAMHKIKVPPKVELTKPKPLPKVGEAPKPPKKPEIKKETVKAPPKTPKKKGPTKAKEAPKNPFYPKPQVADTKTPEPVDIGLTTKDHPLILAGERVLAKGIIGPDPNTGIPKYSLIEPDISATRLETVKENIKKKIASDPKALKDDKYLKKQVEKVLKKDNVPITAHAYEDMKYYLWRDLLFAGRIDPFMRDKHITMITCEGVNKPAKVIFQGNTIETNLVYKTADELNTNLMQIAKMVGKEINKQNPILDVVHGDFRIEATYGDQGVNSRFIIRRVVPQKAA